LIGVEIRERRNRGEAPKEWEYLERFPDASLSDLPVSIETTARLGPDAPSANSNEVTLDSRFANLRLHQRGGLGEVVRAEDVGLHRQVALKFIRADAAADGHSRDQFLLEAEITGRLDHPGVVPVFGIGTTHDNRPFYAMRFIEGTTLRQAIDAFHEQPGPDDDHRMQLRRLLAHLTAACRTIHYAHNRGVIHRDIKPDNIMIGRFGETFVVDWGLAIPFERNAHARESGEATLLADHKEATQGSGKGAGTPSYMSPEQAVGAELRFGPASDIFSLGATLYRLLCGRAPYDPFDTNVRERARRCEYQPLREVRRGIPRALEAICRAAMRPNPNDRYQTAGELADDIERWMADEPVTAITETMPERLVRFFRRHRAWTLALAGCTLMAIVFFGGSSVLLGQMARQEHDQRIASESARRAAEVAREQGLITAAELGAKIVSGEVEHRWQVLGDAARSTAVRESLAEREPHGKLSPDQRQRLQAWLDGLYAQHQQSLRFQNLFVLDGDGMQIACSPSSTETVGTWWGYRSVFHGGPHDLDPNTSPDEVRPARHEVLSTAFLDDTSDEVMVDFSVPIWNEDQGDPEAHALGMLAMSVPMADFTELDTLVGDAFLVDLRESRIGDERRRGLILEHSRSRRSDFQMGSESADVAWLDSSCIERADRLTNLVRRSARHGHRMTVDAGWWGDLADPILPDARLAATAAWPVKLRTRDQIPWLVMVRQR
jgi:serine/threonine-protein kinase